MDAANTERLFTNPQRFAVCWNPHRSPIVQVLSKLQWAGRSFAAKRHLSTRNQVRPKYIVIQFANDILKIQLHAMIRYEGKLGEIALGQSGDAPQPIKPLQSQQPTRIIMPCKNKRSQWMKILASQTSNKRQNQSRLIREVIELSAGGESDPASAAITWRRTYTLS